MVPLAAILALGFAGVTPAPYLTDLFTELDARLPNGQYRIPSLVSTPSGTLLAIINGREHRRDVTPNIIYLRRSVDDGATWSDAVPLLSDPNNATEYGGAPVVDPTGAITYVHTKYVFGSHGCGGCVQWGTRSVDDGLTWSTPQPLNVSGSPANETYGGALASGVTLKNGAHAGRMMVALRGDCCGQERTSFVIYSDDRGASWRGGQKISLLPQYGGGWTECQVAELQNGSVLLTSRNAFDTTSGQGPRMFARSDDGGVSWAANWSAYDLPDPYCEGSLLSDPKAGTLLFGNPSHAGHRLNFSVHRSADGGRTWPRATVVYAGDAAYSDMAFTRNGSVAVLFERGSGGDPYRWVSFGVLPVPQYQ